MTLEDLGYNTDLETYLKEQNLNSFNVVRVISEHRESHRELIVLETGGILIDNPGMREVGIADATVGLEITFDPIIKLSQNCKFKDCTHIQEIATASSNIRLTVFESTAVFPFS